MSYVQSTLHWRQVAWVGHDVSGLGPHLYAGAHFAGCPRTLRSTSGYHLAIEGPNTSLPETGCSVRQTALSNSTPNAEFVACLLAHKKAFLPSPDLYDKLLPKGYHKVVHEDSQAMIQIAHTGINKTMRWLSRTMDWLLDIYTTISETKKPKTIRNWWTPDLHGWLQISIPRHSLI